MAGRRHMATDTKKSLSGSISDEMDRLKTRMERRRLAGLTIGGQDVDKAAYVILRLLVNGGDRRVSSVAHYFGFDVSTISRHVTWLEGEGLVERVADPDDGRAQLLRLTQAGAERYATVRAGKAAIVEEQLADWSKSDCSLFVQLLSRYNDAMDQRFGTPAVLNERTETSK
jgi:DNA-binding MarR family transcriptional regulator